MIELKDVRNPLEPLLELLNLSKMSEESGIDKENANLLEMITQLDNRCGIEHACLVQEESAMLERVNVTLDQKQVGTALDG